MRTAQTLRSDEADIPKLPSYHEFLKSFHDAFEPELSKAVHELPLFKGDRVLDIGCGDGTFSLWLADRVMPDGHVTGVDSLDAYLDIARRRAAQISDPSRLDFRRGMIESLPFPNEHFDFVWCAQCLYSFPNPLKAVQEMARVTRRGGLVAIMEDDTLHQILLPWPIELELALRMAEWRAFNEESKDPKKYYIGRGLRALLEKSKLRPQVPRHYTFYRESPLTPEVKRFLTFYFDNLRDRARKWLATEHRRMFDQFLDRHSPEYLPHQPHFTLTYFEKIIWGKKP